VKYGLRTGANKQFFYKTVNGRGNYRIVDYSKVLNDNELKKLKKYEKLDGIDPNKYQGRFIVPLDKGGESDINENWLPNYFRNTDYYIDWSEKSVNEIKKIKGMRNPNYYFREGIAFSWTGQYAPTFRLNIGKIFDQSASCIFQEYFPINELLGILCSKSIKFLLKNFIDHTINTDISAIKDCTIFYKRKNLKKISGLVNQIFIKQKQNPKYDYMTNEQIEIDKLVYEMYNLNEEDIEEVENWYFRRYPKLAKVIEEKLKKKNKGE